MSFMAVLKGAGNKIVLFIHEFSKLLVDFIQIKSEENIPLKAG